jgi:hypothetical protein
MRSARTLLVALVGIALPIGLALAVYLSSPGTIAANPVSLPASALAQGSPAALKDDSKPKTKSRKHDHEQGTTASSGTTTTDDHGGSSGGSDDHSGSGSSGSDSNSGSGSSGSDAGGDD